MDTTGQQYEPVLVWYVPLRSVTDAALLRIYRALMTAQERAQEARFHFDRDRHRYLVTRALARTALGRMVALDPGDLLFTTNAYGRPGLRALNDACTRLSFNISHTRDLVVLGVTYSRALGLDTENVTDRPAPLDIADNCFSAEEVRALRALPATDQHERFFDYWTLKESYIKARGMGLSIPLNEFSFRLPCDGSIRLDMDASLGDSPQRWMFYQYRPLPSHILSLAVESGRRPVAITISESIPLVAERRANCVLLRCSPNAMPFTTGLCHLRPPFMPTRSLSVR